MFDPNLPEYWVDGYWFAGDPRITKSQRAILTGHDGFQNIVELALAGDG